MSYWVYGERMSGVNWTGAMLIVLSICLGELRVLPPPPPWVPEPLRVRWERAREAQLAAAAAGAVVPEEEGGHELLPAEQPLGAQLQLEERVGLLAAEQPDA